VFKIWWNKTRKIITLKLNYLDLFVLQFGISEPPGKVIDLKVTDSTYTSLSLSWTKPKEEEDVQDEAKGYFVELRPAENTEWGRCNSNPIISSFYTILGLKSMAMYWVRVVATNEGGDGEPRDLDNYIIAMPPPGIKWVYFFYNVYCQSYGRVLHSLEEKIDSVFFWFFQNYKIIFHGKKVFALFFWINELISQNYEIHFSWKTFFFTLFYELISYSEFLDN